MRTKLIVGALLLLASALAAAAKPTLQQIAEFSIPEANQGIGVDDRHFYAVDNRVIGKYDKKTGKLVKKWEGDKKGPIMPPRQRDADGRQDLRRALQLPRVADDELARDLRRRDVEHVGTHSFGIQWGSLTWVDWHDNHWWMRGGRRPPVRAGDGRRSAARAVLSTGSRSRTPPGSPAG